MSKRWVLKDGDEEIVVVEASAADRTVTIQIATPAPVVITPDQSDKLRSYFGLASGVARGEAGARDV